MALNFHGNGISAKFQKPVFIHTMSTSEKSSFSISVFSWVRTVRPKLGVFPKFMIFTILFCFITQLIKRLQQWSLNEVIEDIRPFILNTKRPLSDIWLLRYKQNSFGCFRKNSEVKCLLKNTQNCFAYNSATKYRSEAVLYSKRTAGCPLSPEIKTIAVAILLAE